MRMLLILIGTYQATNGAFMLAAPELWYASVPGVTETGPANIHFIRDIGLGFLAAAASLFIAARQGASAALVPAAFFLGGHALLHLGEMPLHGATGREALRDLLFIVAPGLFPAYALWLRRESLFERSA